MNPSEKKKKREELKNRGYTESQINSIVPMDVSYSSYNAPASSCDSGASVSCDTGGSCGCDGGGG